jgi:hypothetical protein
MHTWSHYQTGFLSHANAPENLQERFRAHFTWELARCARHRLPLAESFGRVFEQTLALVPVDEDLQRLLYWELLGWAKRSSELFPAIHGTYSQRKSPSNRLCLGPF